MQEKEWHLKVRGIKRNITRCLAILCCLNDSFSSLVYNQKYAATCSLARIPTSFLSSEIGLVLHYSCPEFFTNRGKRGTKKKNEFFFSFFEQF